MSGTKVPPPRDPSSGQQVLPEELYRTRAHTSWTQELPAEEESQGEQDSIVIQYILDLSKLLNFNFFFFFSFADGLPPRARVLRTPVFHGHLGG